MLKKQTTVSKRRCGLCVWKKAWKFSVWDAKWKNGIGYFLIEWWIFSWIFSLHHVVEGKKIFQTLEKERKTFYFVLHFSSPLSWARKKNHWQKSRKKCSMIREMISYIESTLWLCPTKTHRGFFSCHRCMLLPLIVRRYWMVISLELSRCTQSTV